MKNRKIDPIEQGMLTLKQRKHATRLHISEDLVSLVDYMYFVHFTVTIAVHSMLSPFVDCVLNSRQGTDPVCQNYNRIVLYI